MAKIVLSFLSMCSLAAALPNPLSCEPPVIIPPAPSPTPPATTARATTTPAASVPSPACSLDTNNPSGCDPSTPPKTISFPKNKPNYPFPSGIPTQTDICDGQNPSQDCFNALSGSGGYLHFDSDSQCSDTQKSTLETAVWDATTLASYSSNFPNAGEGTQGTASGIFDMGPDFASQSSRIAGSLQRAWQLKTDKTSGKAYITTSCKDTKKWYGKMIDGKAVGN